MHRREMACIGMHWKHAEFAHSACYRMDRHSGHVLAPLVEIHLNRQPAWNLFLQVLHGFVGKLLSIGEMIE